MKAPANIVFKPVTGEHIPETVKLSAAVHWNQQEDELRDLISRSGKYILGAFAEGKLVGMAAYCPFPESGTAYLNEVIVAPEMRNRGIASAVIERLINMADNDYSVHRLCATDMGRPLYEKAGFLPYAELYFGVVTFESGIPETGDIFQLSSDDLADVFELDRKNYGADRSFVLRKFAELYPQEAWAVKKGDRLTGFVLRARGQWLAQAETGDELAVLLCHADRHTQKPLPSLIRKEVLDGLRGRMEIIFKLTAMQKGSELPFPEAVPGTMLLDIG